MKRVSLLDSIFTRLVAWAIAISIAVVLLLGGLVTAKFDQMSSNAAQATVAGEAMHMREMLASRGLQEFIRYVDQAQSGAHAPGAGVHYFLANAAGTKLAGDLPAVPRFREPNATQGPAIVMGDIPVFAQVTQLSPDLSLVIARETGASMVQMNQLGLAFVLGGLFVVLAVGVAGYMTARRLSRRVRRINAAFRDPDPQRLAALGTGQHEADEIGELTRHSSSALARLNRLAHSHRDTADQVAHEMRTPLMHLDNRLVRAIQTLSDKDSSDAETAERLIEARGEIRHVVATLESLLDIAHSEAQRGNTAGLIQIDLTRLATDLVELYGASAEDTGHVLELCAEPGVTMEGDEIQITRLITNLLDNAFKYVPSGGHIVLGVARGPVIEVRDDGPGIADEYRDTIFERFGRGAQDGGARKGAGLGLALARAIAQRHGMELRLAPSVRGARFQMRPVPKLD